MRILVTGAGIAAALMVSSCSTKKQFFEEQTLDAKRTEQSESAVQVSTRLETEYLGDILTGRVPLPYTVPRAATYQIESGGITLDITLTDSTLEYRAEAKPVARSTLIREDSSFQSSNAIEETLLVDNKKETKKTTGLPWWIWPALILVIALGLLIKLGKIKLPF